MSTSEIKTQIMKDANRAREKAAASAFDREKVFKDLRSAALKGYNTFRITQHDAVDLRDTKAALELMIYLAEHGFTFRWIEVTREADGKNNPTQMLAKYAELVIEW